MAHVDGIRIPPTNAVILVRHGRTKLNREERLRGHLDPSLDLEGKREVHQLARVLAACNFAKIISSPLQRARQTAVAIDQMHHLGVTSDDRLIDRDYADFAGERRDDVIERFGSLDAAPGVEPAAAVLARAVELLDELIPALGSGVTVLVSHDAVNKAVLTSLSHATDIGQRTACWNLIIREDEQWHVLVTDRR